MKLPYLEPEVQVVNIHLESSILIGGSNELLNPNPNPGVWNTSPFDLGFDSEEDALFF